MKTRACTVCGLEKPLAAFSRHRKGRDGRQSWCKACAARYHNEWDRTHPELKSAQNRRGRLGWRHGITAAQWDGMFEAQGGVCAVCGKPETKVQGARSFRLAVDHDHVSGAVRGLLCFLCNTAIGKMGDDPERLRRAAEYLERRGLRLAAVESK